MFSDDSSSNSANTSVNPPAHPVPVLLLLSPQEFFDARYLRGGEQQVLRQFQFAYPASLVAPGVKD